jgi:hypothetical protein
MNIAAARGVHDGSASVYTGPVPMSIARLSLSLAGVVGLLTVAFTAAVVWLLVTQPVTTAETAAQAAQGEVGPLMRAVAGVLYGALEGILKYL